MTKAASEKRPQPVEDNKQPVADSPQMVACSDNRQLRHAEVASN